MPVVVAWIGEMLLSVVGQMALSALAAVGIGFLSHSVGSAVIDSTGIRTMLGSAGPLVDYMGWIGVDQAVTIVLSAWAGRKLTDSLKVSLIAKRKA